MNADEGRLTEFGRPLARRLSFWGVGVLVIVVCLAPLGLTSMPPLLDFPDHLTRMWLISGGADRPPTSGMYKVDWSLTATNVAVDFIGSRLATVLDFWWVVKVVAAVMFLLPPFGAALLGRLVARRWSWWNVLPFLFCWTTTSVAGFISYQTSLGIALLFTCVDIKFVGPLWCRAVLRAILAIIIFEFHPFGAMYFGALLSALDIGPRLPRALSLHSAGSLALKVALVAVNVSAPLIILLLASPHPPGHSVTGEPLIAWPGLSIRTALQTLLSPITTYRTVVDVLFLLPVACMFAILAYRRAFIAHEGLVLAGCALLGLSVFFPHRFGDESWLDRRLPLMATFALFASVEPRETAGKLLGQIGLATALFALSARAVWIGYVWSARAADVRAFEKVIALLPEGAAVLPVQMVPIDARRAPLGRFVAGTPMFPAPTARHLASLAVVQRHDFVPALFTITGQQPLAVRAPWKSLSAPSSVTPDAHVLEGTPSRAALDADPYLQRWRERFSYVLLLNGDLPDAQGPFRPGPSLQLVANQGFARLYHIRRR